MNYLLQTIFEDSFEFIAANDVFEAVHRLKTNKNIEVLIVDVDQHPEQNWDLVHHIKTSKMYDFPVIVLTTNNSEEIKEKSFELGIDEIFFKPFNPVDLVAAVNGLSSTVTISNN